MGNNFSLFEIILFAMLAAFLVYRLRSVLGKRTGHENRRTDIFKPRDAESESDSDNVIALPDSRKAPITEVEPDTPLAAGIAQIKIADRNFDEASFLQGAQAAFEMIINAFATGDGKTLNMLLSEDVYENFASAIRQRELANHRLETTIVGIDEAVLLEAEMKGTHAFVTVKFVSDQINATLDADDTVVDGDKTSVITVTDIWTFSRDTRQRDPNWKLVATRSPS
ncbi:MAG: Tim44/TimA family putative adaptor protein [Alphaproteobacteria bacterium]